MTHKNCNQCEEPLGRVALSTRKVKVLRSNQGRRSWESVIKVECKDSSTNDESVSLVHFDCVELWLKEIYNR